MATEVIFLRVPPEVKLALENQVAGLNKDRALGTREHTMTSFVMACVNQVLGVDAKGADPNAKPTAKKPRSKRRTSERAS